MEIRKITRLAIAELEIETKFAGKLWAYAPVMATEGLVGLGIVVANEYGYHAIPVHWCHVPEGPCAYEAMSAHADELNAARGLGKECAERIIASSLAAQNRQSLTRRAAG